MTGNYVVGQKTLPVPLTKVPSFVCTSRRAVTVGKADVKKIKLALAVASGALLLSACNIGADPTKGMGDAGVDQQHIDKIPASVIEFSDKYSNIEDKCDGHGHRVYTTTRSAGYFVVVADSTCDVGSDPK